MACSGPCAGPMQINPNLNPAWQSAPAMNGQAITRENICAPAPAPRCERQCYQTCHQPPPLLAQTYGSTNAYRQQGQLVPCCWCGGTRPTEKCLQGLCCRLLPERREKTQLVQHTVCPYADHSLEPNPRCTPCLQKKPPQLYKVRGLERYVNQVQELKTSQEKVNTKIYQESMTIRDFKTPGTVPPYSRTCGDRRSFYDRFLTEMCQRSRLAYEIPVPGSLGGEMSLYLQDYLWPKRRDLCGLYTLPHDCRSSISNIASAYATCYKNCNDFGMPNVACLNL